jgi:hypothetical protein
VLFGDSKGAERDGKDGQAEQATDARAAEFIEIPGREHGSPTSLLESAAKMPEA